MALYNKLPPRYSFEARLMRESLMQRIMRDGSKTKRLAAAYGASYEMLCKRAFHIPPYSRPGGKAVTIHLPILHTGH